MLIVLISSISGFFSLQAQKNRLVYAMQLGADQLSKSIASATWHAMLDDHREAAYEIMGTIAQKQGIDQIRMFNREGRLVFTTDPGARPDMSVVHNEVCQKCHDQVPARVKPAADSRVRMARSPRGVETLNMITPIYNEWACSTAECHAHPASVKVLGVLDVALRLDPVRQQAKNVTMEVVLSTTGVVLVGAAFVILFTRMFVAVPIRELIHGAKAVSAMELDQPIEIRHRSQELDELVDAFNVMRERVQDGHRRAERYGADAREQGGPPDRAVEGRPAQASADRPAGLTGPTGRQRGARDQQPRFGRAQPFHAGRADH